MIGVRLLAHSHGFAPFRDDFFHSKVGTHTQFANARRFGCRPLVGAPRLCRRRQATEASAALLVHSKMSDSLGLLCVAPRSLARSLAQTGRKIALLLRSTRTPFKTIKQRRFAASARDERSPLELYLSASVAPERTDARRRTHWKSSSSLGKYARARALESLYLHKIGFAQPSPAGSSCCSGTDQSRGNQRLSIEEARAHVCSCACSGPKKLPRFFPRARISGHPWLLGRAIWAEIRSGAHWA